MVVKKYIAYKKETLSIENILSVFNLLDSVIFPSMTKLLQIALIIPVNSCTCERSFSVLRRLHTWLRCTMGQDRLHHLAILAVEREQVCALNQSQVIDRFAQLKTGHYSLLLKK